MSELLSGESFAGFRIEEVLGRGGMGWVYRIYDPRLDRERALKVLDPSLASDEAFRERFEREMRMAAKVEHPAVVPIYHAGEEDGHLFIVMRLIRGPDLQKLVANEGALDPRRTARIVSAVAGGLDAAHHHGIVHRDVKPANLMLELDSEGERAYLTDFGIGRPSEAAAGLTATGEVVGTADYIAPEQIRAQRADARSDVYTLGCVVYYLLTGEPPFARENQLATLFAHANDERPRPSLLEPGLPTAIDDVVGRATAIEPDERFQTAGALAAALSGAVGPSTPSEPKPLAPLPGAVTEADLGPAAGPPRPPRPPPLPPERPTSPAGGVEATTRIPREKGRRALWVPLAVIGIVAAAAVAFILVSRDGGGPQSGDRSELKRIAGVADFPVTEGGSANTLVAGVNNVLVLSEEESTLYPVDPESGALGRTPQQVPSPSSIAIGFQSYWVASRGDGAVFRFGPDSREIPDEIGVGGAPSDVAIDIRATTAQSSSGSVWVANEGDSTVSRIDPVALVEDASLALESPPSAIAAGDGGIWALSEAAGTVTRIDPDASGPLGDASEAGESPVDIAVDGSVWIVDASARTLIELSPKLEPIGEPTELTGTPVAVATGLNAVWVATRNPNTVIEVEPATADPVAEAAIDGKPTSVSVPPPDAVDATAVWVATEEGTVSRISRDRRTG